MFNTHPFGSIVGGLENHIDSEHHLQGDFEDKLEYRTARQLYAGKCVWAPWKWKWQGEGLMGSLLGTFGGLHLSAISKRCAWEGLQDRAGKGMQERLQERN